MVWLTCKCEGLLIIDFYLWQCALSQVCLSLEMNGNIFLFYHSSDIFGKSYAVVDYRVRADMFQGPIVGFDCWNGESGKWSVGPIEIQIRIERVYLGVIHGMIYNLRCNVDVERI